MEPNLIPGPEPSTPQDPSRPPRRAPRWRILLLVLAPLLLAVGVVWLLTRPTEPSTEEHAHEDGTYWTCTMHPQVVRDGPGDCPICGMQLVQRTRPGRAPAPDATSAPHSQDGGADRLTTEAELRRVTLSPSQRVLANVATVPAGRRELSPELAVVGRIAFAETLARTVSATVSGRVEALSVTFTGQPVRAGQPLLRIFSPELLGAQQEYLAARRGLAALEGSTLEGSRTHAAALVEGAEQRLGLLGMTAGQVRALAAGEAVGTSTAVVSPYGGTVLRRAVEVGQYVGQGQPLLWVVPLNPVWVLADVYEQDLAAVRVGTRLAFETPAAPGRTFTARVEFIDPFVDPATRTARVRATVPNPGGVLRPGMYVRARAFGTARTTEGVAVPATAVMERGERAVVWVEVEPNVFEPRDVRLGARADGWVEVLDGLREGEPVAVSGTFLLDSEAQLRSGATTGMEGHDM